MPSQGSQLCEVCMSLSCPCPSSSRAFRFLFPSLRAPIDAGSKEIQNPLDVSSKFIQILPIIYSKVIQICYKFNQGFLRVDWLSSEAHHSSLITHRFISK